LLYPYLSIAIDVADILFTILFDSPLGVFSNIKRLSMKKMSVRPSIRPSIRAFILVPFLPFFAQSFSSVI
jgi:hypothetical protein